MFQLLHMCDLVKLQFQFLRLQSPMNKKQLFHRHHYFLIHQDLQMNQHNRYMNLLRLLQVGHLLVEVMYQ